MKRDDSFEIVIGEGEGPPCDVGFSASEVILRCEGEEAMRALDAAGSGWIREVLSAPPFEGADRSNR